LENSHLKTEMEDNTKWILGKQFVRKRGGLISLRMVLNG